MTPLAAVLFLLGFAASWVAGRYIARAAALLQAGAIGLCGVTAVFLGLPGVLENSFGWAIVALLIYGLVGAVIFRSAQAARENAQ